MKMTRFILSFLVFSLLAAFSQATEKSSDEKKNLEMPDKVKAVVEKSCFGCHNTDSRNEDAKEELDFKTLNDLKAFKQIGTLRDIAEVLEEDEMPPKKFGEKYPERIPTKEEEKLLSDWVKKEAKRLIENQ